MGTDKRKAQVVMEAKDKASKTIKKVDDSFTNLVAGVTAGNLAAKGAEKAFGLVTGAFNQLVDATQVAARIQVLNRVFQLTGQNAGNTREELEDAKDAIIDLGIAEQQALEIGQRFIQAQLDIADATKVARAAQDLAVISGQNSSDTALALTDAIVKQQPRLLKQFGILADLNDIYGAQATVLGKNIDELNKTEKRQAFLNEILRQSETVAGSYVAAMKDVGKQVTSLPRHMQNAQNAVGKLFLPAMQVGVSAAKDFLVGIKNIADALNKDMRKALRSNAKEVDKFAKTSATLEKLTGVYEKLTEEGIVLTADEQERLGKVTAELAEIVPGAITDWNEYGEAVGISRERVLEFIEAQKQAIRAGFIQNVRQVRKEFRELSEIDPTTLTDKLHDLAAEVDRLEKIPLGSRVRGVDKNLVDPLVSVKSQLASTREELTGFNEKLSELITFGGIAFPKLEQGTAQYKDALVLLGPELTSLVEKHQQLADADTAERLKKQQEEENERLAFANRLQNEAKDRLIERGEAAQEGYEREIESIDTTIGAVGALDVKRDDSADSQIGNINRVRGAFETATEQEVRKFERAQARKRAIVQRFQNEMTNILGRGIDNMVDNMFSGRMSMKDIFKGMAEDFMKFFIKQAIFAIINVFIPGLGSALGGIFDTRKNDLMAMTQGRHFAQFFTMGALTEVNRNFVPSFAGAVSGANAGGAPAGFAGVASGPSAGVGTSPGLTLNFLGPVTSRKFVIQDMIPLLEQATSSLGTKLLQEANNLTGEDNAVVL